MKKLIQANVNLTIPWNVFVDVNMSDENICQQIQTEIFDVLGMEKTYMDEESVIESIELYDVPEPNDLKSRAEYLYVCALLELATEST